MSTDFEVAVVGDGILGAFVVQALTRGRCRASDIGWFGDQARFQTHSATSYSGGLVRCGTRPPKHDDAVDAFEMRWRNDPALHRTGALETVSDMTSASTRAAELRRRGIDARILRGSQITELTGVRHSRMKAALYEPAAGYVDARGLRDELRNEAAGLGVSLLHQNPVVEIDDSTQASATTIRTQDGEFTARSVVVVAGAGTKALVPEWENLTELRKIGYGFFSGLLPIGLPTLTDDERGLWWRPAPTAENPDRYLVGRAEDARAVGRASSVYSPDQESYIREGLRGYLDNADKGRYLGGVLSFDACARNFENSRHLMISATHRVISATNFDGGGFKRAPALARQIASMTNAEEWAAK